MNQSLRKTTRPFTGICCMLIVLGMTTACDTRTTTDEVAVTDEEHLAALYTPDNLDLQDYEIDPSKDTLLRGKNGTVLRIFRNTFVDADGKPLTSPVRLSLKEALDAEDIVLANLTTTSNGQPLQTGGMIWLGATSNDREVRIAGDKAIGVMIPQKELLKNMSVYTGSEENGKINWVEPKQTLNAEVDRLQNAPKVRPKAAPAKSVNEIDAILGYVDSDTTGMHAAQENEKRQKDAKDAAAASWFSNDINQNQNLYEEDAATSYIFEMKKLGWANIDRLYEDPRTSPVNLVTTIQNEAEFKQVYITMVISGMHLPGYQMKNKTFSFTHNDSEKHELPIGEKAAVFATAYKNGVPYFAITTVKIQPSLTIKLDLKETSKDAIRQALKTQL